MSAKRPPVPPPVPGVKQMTMERLRRQVFTIETWARKNNQKVIEDWAKKSVDFIGEQMIVFAKKIAQLRADVASAESEKAILKSKLTIANNKAERSENITLE